MLVKNMYKHPLKTNTTSRPVVNTYNVGYNGTLFLSRINVLIFLFTQYKDTLFPLYNLTFVKKIYLCK